jgi:hypothetical protein
LRRAAVWAAAYDRGIRRALQERLQGLPRSEKEQAQGEGWKLFWYVEGPEAALAVLAMPAGGPAAPAPTKKTTKERQAQTRAAEA